MHVEKLHVRNFKSIEDLDLNIEGRSLFIRGKNGAGKSTFIQSIYGPLTGKEFPSESVTKGKRDGEIEVTVGDGDSSYTVSVYFDESNRDKGKLTVRSADGRKINAPRSFLDTLVGKIAFDPFDDFINLTMDKKVKFIKELIGVNLDALDAEQKEAYDERTYTNRTIKELDGVISSSDMTEAEIKLFSEKKDIAAISQSISDANTHNAKVSQITTLLASLKEQEEAQTSKIRGYEEDIVDYEEQIEALKRKITDRRELQAECDKARTALQERIKDGQKQEKEAKVIDITELQEKYEEAVQFNRKADQVTALNDAMEQREILRAKSESYGKEIERIKAEKLKILNSKKMPVQGLKLDDDMLYLDGLPFEKEQIPMSTIIMAGVNIMMQTNPKIKIARIKDGALLDKVNQIEIIEQCQELGFQVFLEVVESEGDGIAVEFVED